MTARAWASITRAAAITVATLLVVLALVGLRAVYGAEPSTACQFPFTLDTFQAVSPGSTWTFTMQNSTLCALNALERVIKLSGVHQTPPCVSTTVAASTRQLVPVSIAVLSPLTGTEPVFASVIDTTNPSRLQMDGIQGASGTTVSVWVFNRDATNSRTGKVCASVVHL